MQLKVLVVDDTIFYRKIVGDILETFPFVEVVGTASNGEIALARIKLLEPDLLTLDVQMPVMDGLQVLQTIQKRNLEVDCLLLSARTLRGSSITMQALELGAFDFITKPDDISPEVNRDLLTRELRKKLRIYHERRQIINRKGRAAPIGWLPSAPRQIAPKAEVPQAREVERLDRHEKSLAVAIGISTGGPYALGRMLPMLPPDIGVPIFLVQHMPPLFTTSLAKSLDSKCQLTVKEGTDGETVQPNVVYVAPGGRQMQVASGVGYDKIIRVTDAPAENNCKPSVDYLFRSVVREYGSKTTCVLMTGMGVDGRLGLEIAKASGSVNIVQDETTSIVFGMPKVAIEAGLAHVVAPLDRLPREIMATLK